MTQKQLIVETTERVIAILKQEYYLVPRDIPQNTVYKAEFIEIIIQHVCQSDGISPIIVRSETRDRQISEIRMIICYMIRKYCEQSISLKLMGKFLNRDHSSIVHYLGSIKVLMEHNKFIRRRVENICSDFEKKYVNGIRKVKHSPEITS